MEAKDEVGSRPPWQPREEALTEICGILELEVLKTSRIEKSQYMQQQQLRHYSQSPDFNNYLVFVLSRAEGRSLEIRKAAGLLLKNNLRNGFTSMSPANQQYIKFELLSCLGSPDRKIRSTTASIISIIVQLGGIIGWPELLHALGTWLDGDDLNQLHGAMDALSKICKGVPQVLDSDVPGMNERPLNLFLPRFFKLFQSPHSMLRKLALSSVNQYIMLMPAFLYKSMDQYLQGLFVLANDTMPEVQKLVYDAFVKLIEVHPSLLQPHLRNVIEYALQVSQDGGDKLAVEAREFWAAYSDAPLPPENLREFLQRLIPALPSNKVYASDDESLAEAEEDEFVGDRVPDQKPMMNISAQEWESLIEDFQFGGSRRHQWTSQFTPLSLLDLSLSSLLKNDLNSSIKLEILIFLQEFSFLFITNEDLRISVSKIIETLKLVIQSPIDGVSVTYSLKEQILVSTTSIIVTLNDEDNGSSFGAVLAELEALVAVLIAIINRPNHVADRQTRAVACECLRVLEERFPGLLAEIVGHLWALCQSEKSHACQSYLLLLLQVINHIVDMKLRVDSIINISVPLAPFNVPNCYGGEELSSKNVKDLRRVVAFLLEWAQVFTPSGLSEFLSMVIPVAVALELQVSLLKVQFSGLLYTLNPLLHHLVVMMYLNFPGSFDGQEDEIMKRLFLISRERHHRLEFRLLSLHWLLSIIGKGSLVSSNRKYIYPNVFDPLALKCLKLDLFALCYISPEEKDVELFVKYLDSFVNGFKWLPSQSTETSVGFRTIHKLLTGTLCHSSATDSPRSKTLLESTIFRTLQSMLLNLILDSQKLVPVVVSLIDRLLQCQNHVFLGENLLQMFDEHLLPKLIISYRLNSYFPIFDRICRSSSISPQRLLGLLKKFMVVLQNEHGPDSGLRSWSQGSRVIRICRTMLMHHHSSRLFIPLSHLLAFTCLYFPDLEVRDNARIYLRMLVCIPGKKLRQMLNFGEQQTGIYMGISPSSHANSFFSVRKSKSISSYINLERAVPLLVKQSWSLSLPTFGLTNKSSDAPVVIKDDVGPDNSEISLEARKIERNPEPLRVMDAKITRILETLRLHFSCIPDVKIKIPCVLRFKSEPYKSIYATVLAFSSTAPYGNIPSFRIPFLTEKSGAAVTIEIEPREPVPGLVDVSVQSNAENGDIIDGQIQSISVGIEDMFLRAIAPPNITNDQTPDYYSNLFEALWEACGSSSNTGREIFSMKNGKGVATIHGTQSVKLIQARSSYVIHVIEQNLARFVVSVMGEPLVTMVKDGGFVKDVFWKVVTADSGAEKAYSDYEQWPLYLTYYNEEEDGEDGMSSVVKKNLGCFQVLVFLPPRFHLLLHFEVSDVSTLVRIRTDHWPCLAYIDDYLEALFVL